MAKSFTVGVAGLAISVIAIGISLFVYVDHQAAMRSIDNKLNSTSSRLHTLERSVSEINSSVISIQERIHQNELQDDETRQDMNSLYSDFKAMQNRTYILEEEVNSLKQAVSQLKLMNQSTSSPEEPSLQGKRMIWYDDLISGIVINGTLEEQANKFGIDFERRIRPIDNLAGADLVVLAKLESTGVLSGTGSPLSETEVNTLTDYVKQGGRLVIATDNDFYYCNPSSTCAASLAENFGFQVGGNAQFGTLVPAAGQSGYPIWNTPNSMESFESWCCDAYITNILDPVNVKTVGIIEGTITSTTAETGTITVRNPPAIVVNANPDFNGGIVMGIGRDMLIGNGSDPRMFENVINFMLQ